MRNIKQVNVSENKDYGKLLQLKTRFAYELLVCKEQKEVYTPEKTRFLENKQIGLNAREICSLYVYQEEERQLKNNHFEIKTQQITIQPFFPILYGKVKKYWLYLL